MCVLFAARFVLCVSGNEGRGVRGFRGGWAGDYTHGSGPGERDPALKRRPVVVGPLPVGEGAVESRADVVHAVHAHGVALEYVAVSKREDKEGKRIRGGREGAAKHGAVSAACGDS